MKIDREMLDSLVLEAAASKRRRKNLNFHPRDDFPAHRLLNAIEPDSYIPPHRHLDPAKDESFVILRGRVGVLFFSAAGEVEELALLEPNGEAVGVDIPHGRFHSLVSLSPGSVVFEAKAGPYVPLSPEEKAPWAPGENEPAAAEYLEKLRNFFA